VSNLSEYDRQTLEYLAAAGVDAGLIARVRASLETNRNNR